MPETDNGVAAEQVIQINPKEVEAEGGLALSANLEALLFAAPSPVNTTQLASALQTSIADIEHGLATLDEELRTRGIRLQKHMGRYQLTTAAEAGELVETFLGLEATSRLSNAALEALAIIAYQQPVTRPQIDTVRGVNSDGVLKSLLTKGLIQEMGRAEGPGRPILYGTTTDFLNHFGLNNLKELPPLELEEDTNQVQPDQPLLKD